VSLELNWTESAGVTFTPSTLVWEAGEFTQTREFVITVAEGTFVTTAMNGEIIELSSRSELYAGFQPQFQLTVGSGKLKVSDEKILVYSLQAIAPLHSASVLILRLSLKES
jgi:hypothetical protein